MGGRIWLGRGRFDGDDFGGCEAVFFACIEMGDEAVNGINTGVCGRFMACGWGCVHYDEGRGKGMGIKWR